MNDLVFVRISREISQIQNVFYLQFLRRLLIHHVLILLDNFHYTASYGAVT